MKTSTVIVAVAGAVAAFFVVRSMGARKGALSGVAPSMVDQLRRTQASTGQQPSRASGSTIDRLGSAAGQVGSALLSRFNSAGDQTTSQPPDLSRVIASLF